MAWGYWPYYNPYCVGPFVEGGITINYSQPIVVAQPAVALPVAPTGPTAEEQATPLLDAARAAFMQGDYRTALAQVDQAIALVPNDTVLHEFRGLVLFALGRYNEAAAADYAVLSVGPGWDWTTLSGLYPNVEVYTEQLRALEQYAREHPAESGGEVPAGRTLPDVRLQRCRRRAAQGGRATESQGPVVRATAQQPLRGGPRGGGSCRAGGSGPARGGTAGGGAAGGCGSLVGNWTATRPDSATIKLALGSDGKFTWTLDQSGKPQQFSGTYSLADNLLVLKQGDNPVMVGQVVLLAGDRFNFKLAGDNPSDPGLTFAR